jgi:hypothetical protein
MLFRNVRAGDEVILATSQGRGGEFTYSIATVEDVKSAIVVVDGFKFKTKDGMGRTVPHRIFPADAASRRQYLGDDSAPEAAGTSAESVEPSAAEDKLRKVALDALRIIRGEADPSQDDEVIDLIGVEALAAFRRHWRRLHGEKK